MGERAVAPHPNRPGNGLLSLLLADREVGLDVQLHLLLQHVQGTHRPGVRLLQINLLPTTISAHVPALLPLLPLHS